MPCEIKTNDEGKVSAIICSAPWGMGVTDYGPEDGEEFRYIYGFGGHGDPHDFEPDFDWNTKTEIKNWKAAKAACQCGREPKNICDTCGQDYTVNANYDKHDCNSFSAGNGLREGVGGEGC